MKRENSKQKNRKQRNMPFCLLILLLILCLAGALILFGSRRQRRKPIRVEHNPCSPTITLTFDDGPNATYTPQILDILYQHQVPATFFVVGEKVEKNEQLIREMNACGHKIELHSFSHPDLTTLSCEKIQYEFRLTEKKIQEILPDYSANYFRPPYGRYTEDTEKIVGIPMMLWTLDSRDWKSPNAQDIFDTVMCSVQDGDIIIFHDDNAETVKALKLLIPALREEGFQFK
ncbi:MAG: polysaccharide deacetylase family protein [Bariatricus sp.]